GHDPAEKFKLRFEVNMLKIATAALPRIFTWCADARRCRCQDLDNFAAVNTRGGLSNANARQFAWNRVSHKHSAIGDMGDAMATVGKRTDICDHFIAHRQALRA